MNILSVELIHKPSNFDKHQAEEHYEGDIDLVKSSEYLKFSKNDFYSENVNSKVIIECFEYLSKFYRNNCFVLKIEYEGFSEYIKIETGKQKYSVKVKNKIPSSKGLLINDTNSLPDVNYNFDHCKYYKDDLENLFILRWVDVYFNDIFESLILISLLNLKKEFVFNYFISAVREPSNLNPWKIRIIDGIVEFKKWKEPK
nr:MAG TPA: hypothetical protein [Caudoviricetes sp.]